MKKPIHLGALALVPLLVFGGMAVAQSVASLRGADVDEPVAIDDVHRTIEGRMQRNYRQQPPLIPHRTEGYQVTKDFNKCLSCHGWPQNAQYGAPKVSETHYVTRSGSRTDEISGGRWFCTQCHVPQADAQALVPNAFKNARELSGAFK